jgi:hypothetical protein
MLSPDQVRPFLLHDEDLVRERALVYFAEAGDRSLLNADDLWAVIDRFGPVAAPLQALRKAIHTATSTERLVREIVNGPDKHYLRTLQEVAAGLPVDQVEMLWPSGSGSQILGASRSAAEQRLALSREPADKLWAKLVAQAERCESQREWGNAYCEGSRIVEALARFQDDSAARAMDLFAKEETRDRWLEVFLVDLAGELRHEPAAPHLFDVVSRDGDFVNDRAALALGRIATDAVAAQILESDPCGPSSAPLSRHA